MKLKEAWMLNRRGFKILNEIQPTYMLVSAVSASIDAVQPLIILFFSSRILNELSGKRNINNIVLFVVLTVLLGFLLTIINAWLNRKLSVIGSSFNAKMFYYLGERYMAFDFEHVENAKTNEKLADIEAKIKGDGLGVPRLYWSFPELIKNAVGLFAAVILLVGLFNTGKQANESFITSPLATIVLGLLIVLMLIMTLALRKTEQSVLEKLFEDNPKTNSFFQYYFEYIQAGKAGKDIRLYNQSPIVMSIAKKWLDATPWHKYFDFDGKLGGMTAAANAFIGGCIYLFIGLRALLGMYTIGGVVQYVGAITNLVQNISALVTIGGGFLTNSQYLKLLYQYTDLPDKQYKGSLTTEKRVDNEYELEFHNVSFHYPGSDEYALKNLSLKLRIGERLAVVGMNGSGKTTMIKLLCRLYDPTEGEITLNGIDIKKYDCDEYMKLFSVVFQDFRLFSFPLGQNIAASADINVAKAEACLEKAGLSDRIKEMPLGLDTCLHKDFDEDGVDISGGEAQKIALARALYKDSPIIILDEPTAALDPIAEYEIYSKFDSIVGGKTAIYISHRLSSCRFCHDIAVFHEGELIQRGSHDALLANQHGKYFALWNAQAQYYTENRNAAADPA